MNLFKPIPVYIKVYRDKIEITNLATGETSSRRAIESFSNERLVVSNFNIASELIMIILKDLKIKNSFLPASLKVLIQQMEGFEGGLSDIEKRALRDLAEQAGGRSVFIATNTEALDREQALDAFKQV